jgi:PAS domain S-box-containing protein
MADTTEADNCNADGEKVAVGKVVELLKEMLYRKDISGDLTDFLREYPEIRQLTDIFFELRQFTADLSQGDLSTRTGQKGYWAGLLKALQSNLRHLTWQTSMVADGDFSQRVDFMGDFSKAFNKMTRQLEEAEEKEKGYTAALQDSERKYRLIAENTDDVIWLVNGQLDITYVSPSIEKLLSSFPEDVTDLPAFINTAPLLRGKMAAMVSACRQSGGKGNQGPVLVEAEQRLLDGKMIWTETMVGIAKDDAGAFIGLLGITRDISKRKNTEKLLQSSYERKRRNDFFNDLLRKGIEHEVGVYSYAWALRIRIPKKFSLFFMEFDRATASTEEIHRNQLLTDTLVDHFNSQEDIIAWEAAGGIGMIHGIRGTGNRKKREMEFAHHCIRETEKLFSGLSVRMGIADYFVGVTQFARRFQHARTAIKIGYIACRDSQVCHFEDCGIYYVFSRFADTDEGEAYIAWTLGPLIEYDRENQTELVDTLERILEEPSLKVVADKMCYHQKTILARKKRIEEILHISLDSFEAKMSLGAAVHILKLLAGKKAGGR